MKIFFAACVSFGFLACVLSGFVSVRKREIPKNAAPDVQPAQVSAIDGFWLIRDSDGAPDSVVAVYEKNGAGYFRMVAIFHNGKIDDTIFRPLERSKGIAASPYLCSFDFVWNLKIQSDGKYSGRVVDPDDGSVYRCEVWVNGKNKKLVLRGEVLIFGESEEFEAYDAKKLPFKIDLKSIEPNPPAL